MFDGNKGQGHAQRQGTKPKIFTGTPSTNFTSTYCRHDLNDLRIQKYVLFITSDNKKYGTLVSRNYSLRTVNTTVEPHYQD
jgi:hypothetical protein